MALETSIYFVFTFLFNDSICKKFSIFMLGVSIRIETYIKQRNIILKIFDINMWESHVLWLLNHNFVFVRVFLAKWVPDFAFFTHKNVFVLVHIDDVILLIDCLGHSGDTYRGRILALISSSKAEGLSVLNAQGVRGIGWCTSCLIRIIIELDLCNLEHGSIVEVFVWFIFILAWIII